MAETLAKSVDRRNPSCTTSGPRRSQPLLFHELKAIALLLIDGLAAPQAVLQPFPFLPQAFKHQASLICLTVFALLHQALERQGQLLLLASQGPQLALPAFQAQPDAEHALLTAVQLHRHGCVLLLAQHDPGLGGHRKWAHACSDAWKRRRQAVRVMTFSFACQSRVVRSSAIVTDATILYPEIRPWRRFLGEKWNEIGHHGWKDLAVVSIARARSDSRNISPRLANSLVEDPSGGAAKGSSQCAAQEVVMPLLEVFLLRLVLWILLPLGLLVLLIGPARCADAWRKSMAWLFDGRQEPTPSSTASWRACGRISRPSNKCSSRRS